MIIQRDISLDDGRTLRAHDSGGSAGALTVMWHHGSPQSGAPLDPLLVAVAARKIRVLSYGRPGYGGSTARPGRDVASAARDVAAVADAFGVRRFATMGYSGGAPHALACAALLADRVSALVCFACPAPYSTGFDWFAGMAAPGGVRAALAGRAARATYAESAEFDESSFTPRDWDALKGRWASLGADASAAGRASPDGLVDDDVALVAPWGFDLGHVVAPVLLVQGGEDRVVPPSHAAALAGALPRVEVWRRPRDGHVSVLDACEDAMDWLRERWSS